jgi:hypothetical protein
MWSASAFRVNTELGEHALGAVSNGMPGQPQLTGDRRITRATGESQRHLRLACRESPALQQIALRGQCGPVSAGGQHRPLGAEDIRR